MSVRIATAEWADPALVEQAYEYHPGTSWLGRSASENEVPLGYGDDRHVCLVSGSRGGKGSSSIVNNLIVWPGSIVCVDPKGENATITAARRGPGSKYSKGLGQLVRVLDPFNAARVEEGLRGRFNPLDTLDPENEESVDEAGRIADAIVVIHEGGTNDPFWDESARSLVKGLLLHVLTAPQYEGRRNLVTLRKLITRGDWESVEALREAGESDIPSAHGLLWTGLANNPAFDGLVAAIGDSFTNMLLNSSKQYESVLQVANRNTEFIDSPAMQRCLESSNFQLAELKTNPTGVSVFLCLPQRYMSTHYRWLRMMIALTVTEMEKVRGRPAIGYPVLMLLDEFAGLKRMEIIESAVAQIAGYGVKMFFVLQSLEQLKAVYKDNWETFLANSGLKIFFNLEDHFSRDYVAKLIGETEVVREVHSASDSKSESESFSQSTTRSRSETKGTSTSTGTSVTDGTNSSVSKGQSWGISKSKGKSWSWSTSEKWTPGLIFRSYEPGVTEGKSESLSTNTTKSEGWNTGQSRGVSHSTSKSRTDGTSESVTTGTSETEGVTRGTSQSRTSGSSETIQKRALITPDEIGQVFARVDDHAHRAYPGLALVVISGARPVALRRVNYFEDYQFIGLFDPHPDYPYAAAHVLNVKGGELTAIMKPFGLSISSWSIREGQVARGGDDAATIVTVSGKPVTRLSVPRHGLVKTVEGVTGKDIPPGKLFSLLHYEDGEETGDPFAELNAFCARVRAQAAANQAEEERKRKADLARKRQRKIVLSVAGGCCALLAVWALSVVARNQSSHEGARVISQEQAAPTIAAPPPKTIENDPPTESAPLTPRKTPSQHRIMMGVIDVSLFAGLKPADTAEHVSEIYGPAVVDQGEKKIYAENITVGYKAGRVKWVEAGRASRNFLKSAAGGDSLQEFFGQPESAIVGWLGPPARRVALNADTQRLEWNFDMSDWAGPSVAPETGHQLYMVIDQSGCQSIQVIW
jgi:type IV secretory pathway TraG/TraD family ATPase VirD4